MMLENLCRLCAEEKVSKELIYHIDNEDIKKKLNICCHWDSIVLEMQDEMPKWICVNCFERLESSWEFAKNVVTAHQKLQLHTTDIKPFAFLEVDAHETLQNELQNELDHKENEAFCEPVNSKTENEKNLDHFIDSTSLSVEEDGMPIGECKAINDVSDLLSTLINSDKNDDGTIKTEKIAELNLDDWSILKSYCQICNIIFDKHRSLRSHFKRMHPKNTLRIYCSFCNVFSQQRPSMFKHIINIHRPYLKFCCKKCNKFYWDLDALKKHTSGIHKNQEALLSVLCEICGKNFSNQSQLKAHTRFHIPLDQRRAIERSFQCYICKMIFGRKIRLVHHMTTHFGRKIEFQCDVCPSKFSRSDALRRHSLIHTGKLPHQCQYCGKGFRTKYNLKTHIHTHTGERPLKCMLCDYCCADSGNIAKHMRQRHGITKTELISRQSMNK